MTVTVPLTTPGDGGQVEDEPLELLEQHVLELLPDPEPLLHDMAVVVDSRLASWVNPKPDAISGRTVTSNMKLATAITAVRIR